MRLTATSLTPAWQTPAPPPVGFQLGEWIVQEGAWSGVWRGRRDTPGVFDARWTNAAGKEVTDVIEIRSVDGTAIVLFRRGLNGTYSGTISEDGRQVRGTASWYSPDEQWTADIRLE